MVCMKRGHGSSSIAGGKGTVHLPVRGSEFVLQFPSAADAVQLHGLRLKVSSTDDHQGYGALMHFQ